MKIIVISVPAIQKVLAIIAIFAMVFSTFAFAPLASAKQILIFSASVNPSTILIGETKQISFTIGNDVTSEKDIKAARIVVPAGFSISNLAVSQPNWGVALNSGEIQSSLTSGPSGVAPGSQFNITGDVTNISASGDTSWQTCTFINSSFSPGEGGDFDIAGGTGCASLTISVDVCSNVAGLQTSVPTGYESLVAGQCTPIPPPPVCEDSNANNQGQPLPCTYDPNTGSITVVKNTDLSEGDTVGFDFTGDLGAFTILGNSTDSKLAGGLVAGTYTITESAETGWSFGSASCIGASFNQTTNGVAVTLTQAGEDAVCTINNTRDTGSLTILKDTDDVSGDSVQFDFSGTGAIGTFDVLGNSTDSQVFSSLPTGSYTVTELDEADWTFGSVTCNEGAVWDNTTDGVIVNLGKDNDVTCTFTNTKDLVDDTTITINKVTNVESADTFNFFLDDSTEASAALQGGQSSGAIVVTPGSHNIVEGVAAGWTLDQNSSSCVNEAQQVVGSFDGSPYYLTLAAGDDIVCTFTNTKDLPPPPICAVGSNLLANASFESPTVTDNGGQWEIFGTVANWVISLSDGLELWNNLMGSASEGVQNAELDSNTSTQITQNVATIPGATYELRFDFSARPDADSAAENSVDALINGVTLMNATADGTDIAVNTWATHAQTFVAAGTSTDVSFKDIGTSNGLGSLIDNAVLCLVSEPEPAKACSVNVISDTSNTVTEKGAINALEVVSEPDPWVDGIIDSLAQWIWGSPAASAIDPEVNETQTFVKTFNWNGPVTAANLQISSDNGYSVTMNGTLVVTDTNEFSYSIVDTIDLTSYIVTGENKLEISVTNNANGTTVIEGNPAGLLYDLTVVGNNTDDCTIVPNPEALSCDSFTSDNSVVSSGQQFTLTWNTTNADSVVITGLTGPLALDGTSTQTAGSDTTYTLTASRTVGEEETETVICSVAIDVQSSGGGGGGSRGSRRNSSGGEVLGASTSREPEVLGVSTTALPLGAPDTGAGGTSPIVVNLPTLFAVLDARTLVRKVK